MQVLLNSIATKFMNVFSFMGIEFDEAAKNKMPWLKVVEPILSLLEGVLPYLLIIIGTAGSIYAIVLGVNYARAETADKRDEAKKRMINAIIGLVAMILLLIILQLFVTYANDIAKWITDYGKNGGGTDSGGASGGGTGNIAAVIRYLLARL